MRIVWLLDVDGVINAFDGTGKVPEGYVGADYNGFFIKHRPSLVQRMRALHDHEHVEIRWLTTWGRQANDHLSVPFGFPVDLVVAAEPPYREKGRWWKLQTVMDLLDADPDLHIVWTDDDIAFDPEARWWLEQPEADNVKAISPLSSTGITDDEFQEIVDWITEVGRVST